MIKNATYKPIIKSYPEYAHLFSILGNPQNDSDFSKWFCWNFIQLRYDSAKDVDEALFFEKDVEECNIYRCSLLDKMIFEKNMFKENTDFQKMATHYLKLGFYIIVVLDHFYIPFDRDYYQKNHRNHECLIYGIDIENNSYLIQDFFNGSYSSCEISMSNFWKAYTNHYDYSIFDDEKIYLFKKKSSMEISRLPFQKGKIKSQFQNYLIGEISSIDDRTYGSCCYNILFDSLENKNIDFRDFSLLYEHTLANAIRIRLLFELDILSSDEELQKSFDEICNQALNLRNLLIKWKITQRLSLETAEKLLKKIQENEIQTISKFIVNM